MRLSWGLPLLSISSGWLCSLAILPSYGPWGPHRYLLVPWRCLSLPNLQMFPRQSHTWIQSCAFSLAQHHQLLRTPMRWQMVFVCPLCPVSCGQQESPCGLSRPPGYVRTQHEPWIWSQAELGDLLWDASRSGLCRGEPSLGCVESGAVGGKRLLLHGTCPLQSGED